MILHTENLSKCYGRGENKLYALNSVNVSVAEGEFLAVIGKSGSGKSTLLNMLGGLDRPTAGEVVVAGRSITKLSPKKLAEYRREEVGFVFQNYNLIPVLNSYENIILPIQLGKKKVDSQYIHSLMVTLGIDEKKTKLPGNLSGGQQQRVSIARALANKPKIILADEPTGNLDSSTSKEVMDMLKLMNRKYKQTLIVVTHDDAVKNTAHRVIQMMDGKAYDGE